MWDEDDSADYDLPTERERGRWLTAAICFVIGYGLALIVLVIMFDSTWGVLAPGWLLPLVIGVGLAEIVAGIAFWRWKMWGLYLYLAATIVALFPGCIGVCRFCCSSSMRASCRLRWWATSFGRNGNILTASDCGVLHAAEHG